MIQVRNVRCPTCGAPKLTPAKTAYVYCDFCGSLTDYDFQKACENPQSNMPGPAYEQLIRDTCLVGPEGWVKERLVAYARAGVTTLLVSPIAADHAGKVRAVERLRILADQV